jgi:NAD+ kinase
MKNTQKKPKKITHLFYRKENPRAVKCAKKIEAWLVKRNILVSDTSRNAEVIIALGGDGTILEAARSPQMKNSVIVGLNLGNVGFLASVREEKNFLPALARFYDGEYRPVRRTMLLTEVIRQGKKIFSATALNEVLVHNLLGVVELEVGLGGYGIQSVRGSGILVSTATGSTAYNLSAHGPIISPDIECLVITELLDHGLPTPSIVVKPEHKIEITVGNFREHHLLASLNGREPIDVLLQADGDTTFPLRKSDKITISGSPRRIVFAELEENYFFKSLREKFSFR